MGGDVTLTAGETNDPGIFADKLTVNAGVTVRSTGGNVTLQAGDDVVLNTGSLVQANTAGRTVTLTAANGDLDAEGAIVVNGVNSVVATNLAMTALNGIGSAANPVVTTVSNLEAQTATGGIFVSDTGDLTIGNVSATLNGVRATTTGDISIVNAGTVNVTQAGENVVAQNGNVTITANGAAANIVTGGSDPTPLAAIRTVAGGNIALTAGQDVLVGNTATLFGNVRAAGGITVNAGRDVIVDVLSFVESGTTGGAGDITVNAGRDISLLQDVLGAHIQAIGTGSVSLTTGANGVFTANGGFGSAGVSTNGGTITITADNMAITATPINAGAGIVTLQQVSAGQVVDLGGADGAGTLGLIDAELDNVTTTSVLRIGRNNAGFTGAISITNPITQAGSGYTRLSLRTNSTVTETGAGSLTVNELAVQANGTVTLAAATNDVTTLAITTGTGNITYRDANGFAIGTVDGVNGLTAPGNVTLNAGAR